MSATYVEGVPADGLGLNLLGEHSLVAPGWSRQARLSIIVSVVVAARARAACERALRCTHARNQK